MGEAKAKINPFDSDNFASGGGLWDGQTVTILTAKAVIDSFTRADGSAVIGDDGKALTQSVLAITAIADGSDAERRETYSAGSLVPTADGEGFVTRDGEVAPFHVKSAAGKFFAAIKAGGYDVSKLYDAATGSTKLSGLVGSRFTMKGEDKLDKNGKPKKNKKGYVMQSFYPVKYVGNAGNGAARPSGNGIDADLKTRAQTFVLNTITASGGNITRSALIGKLNEAFKTEAGPVLAALLNPSFHTGQPWTYNGSDLKLI